MYMGKKRRLKKKRGPKPQKTPEERRTEVDTLRTKILSIGFPLDNDGIVELFGHLELYANEGVTWSGKIPLRGFQRVCEVHLSTLKNRNNIVALKFNENI